MADDKDIKRLEKWLKSYKPEELFDKDGTLIPELRDLLLKATLE